MAQHNELGKWGEQIAREHLLSLGYAISHENMHIGRMEIDFIARKENRLIFVEVKTRSSGYVDPLQSIDTEKQRRLMRAADIFMSRIETDVPLEPQFDLIFIIGTPDSDYTIEHIPDAFYP